MIAELRQDALKFEIPFFVRELYDKQFEGSVFSLSLPICSMKKVNFKKK